MPQHRSRRRNQEQYREEELPYDEWVPTHAVMFNSDGTVSIMTESSYEGLQHNPGKEYYKLWFSGHDEYGDPASTAGLVLDTHKFPLDTPITELSRLFPYSEAGKMHRVHRSPLFDTWEEAFRYHHNPRRRRRA